MRISVYILSLDAAIFECANDRVFPMPGYYAIPDDVDSCRDSCLLQDKL